MRHGISPKLLKDLEQEMIDSRLLNRINGLRSLFVDARISPFQDDLPEADNILERVRAIIEQFYRQSRADTKQNALVLLLQVLSDRSDSRDACRQRLAELAAQLERELKTLTIKQKLVSISPPILIDKKLLIVDDHPDIATNLAVLFKSHGCLVFRAYDGQEGLEKAKANIPHVIILDMMMPKMNGDEMCRQLRRNPETKNIPVLMLTAAGEQHQHEGMDAGINSYMVKPYNTEALVMEVERLLKRTIDA